MHERYVAVLQRGTVCVCAWSPASQSLGLLWEASVPLDVESVRFDPETGVLYGKGRHLSIVRAQALRRRRDEPSQGRT